MRKFKNGNTLYSLKGIAPGVCDMCGGKGRYKETFSYKNAIVRECWKCKGTGNVKIELKYIGKGYDDNLGLWEGSRYELVYEGEDSYTIINRKKELLQIEKDLFEW